MENALRRTSAGARASMEILAIHVGNARNTGSQNKSVPMAGLAMVTIVRGVKGEVSVSMTVVARCVYLVVERNVLRNDAYTARSIVVTSAKSVAERAFVNMATRNTNVGSVSVNERKIRRRWI
jgi:hypothetical protein